MPDERKLDYDGEVRGLWLVMGVALVALAASCRGEKVGGPGDGLEVTPTSLDFGNVFLGATPISTVTLKNEAAFSRPFSVSIEGPFAVVHEGPSIAAGDSVALMVAFSPTEVGPVSGELTVLSETFHVSVSLGGVGLAALDCPVASNCHQSAFDPAKGACVTSSLPDGTGCSNACDSSGQCQAGRCIAASTACDDHDLCTTDSCDAAHGCVHAPRICPTPVDPCRVAVCDPVTACGERMADDGTSCGPSDCDSSMVCVAGTCQSRPTPEGAACGAPSPCQPPGICQGQQCVRAPPAPLTLRWSRPLGSTTVFPGLADSSGNLYWFEFEQLVSVDRDGQDRYRVMMIGSVDPSLPASALLASDDLVVAVVARPPPTELVVEARNTADGSQRWVLGVWTIGAGVALDPGETPAQVTNLVVQATTGKVILLANTFDLQGLRHSLLIGVDPVTGVVQSSVRSDPLQGLVGDSAGNLYSFRTTDQTVVKFALGGTVRWSSAAADVPLLAVDPGVLSIGQWNDATTGAASTVPSPALDPISDGASAFALPATCASSVESFSLIGPPDTWFESFPALGDACLSNLMFTSNGVVLVASSSVLFGFTADVGVLQFACEGVVQGHGDAVLSAGQWVVPNGGELRAYDLSGWSLNSTGWSAARSDMHRSNAAH